jgi:hypothetical protein
MKTSELRIGNYLTFTKSINPAIPEEVNMIEFEDDEINGEDADFWEPIKLTEKWLLRFGYIKKRNTWDGIYHQIEELSSGLFTDRKYGTIFKYVHRLQNFYFETQNIELKQIL